MPPVFAHGRLRLYLLALLAEAPRHGYEVIRLLEERFQGLYAPSAGTVYPRLAKLEAEGLVSHTLDGGRKTYSITEAGQAELVDRRPELAELELEVRDALSALAEDADKAAAAGAGAHGPGVGDRSQRTAPAGPTGSTGEASAGADHTHPRAAGHQRPSLAEELRHAKEQWKEHARKARQEGQQAKRQARREREAHAEALEEVRRIARQVRDQVRTELGATDRGPAAASGGIVQPGYGTGDLERVTGYTTAWPPYIGPDSAAAAEPEANDRSGDPERSAADQTDPEHELLRLLDRFRDDIRDAARDNGVTERQLGAIRRELSTAAAHVAALLGAPEQYFASDGPSSPGVAHDSGSAGGPGGSGRREPPPRSGD